MIEVKTVSTALRRNKRIPQQIEDNNWTSLNNVHYSSSTKAKRDELTGRGFVHYIDNVTAIEFETLDDMKLYDSIAGKMGNTSCASFNEFSRPFQGFSEEECSNSNDNFILFKELANMRYGKNNVSGVNGDIVMKIVESNENSPHECKKVKSVPIGPSKCEPHKMLPWHPYKSATEPLNPILNAISIPNLAASSKTLKVSSGNTGIVNNIDHLLLSPLDSSASMPEQNCSTTIPLIRDPYHSKAIDVSTIPFIYKCFASKVCHNFSACANASSTFTLFIKLTSGKGKALTRFAIEFLDQYKLNQESNTIDRAIASIAASAVSSSTSTVLLPLNKKLINIFFPQSNILHSSKPGISFRHSPTPTNGTGNASINIVEQSECSQLGKVASCAPISTPEIFEMLTDPKRLGVSEYNADKPLLNVDPSNMRADHLNSTYSSDSHDFIENSENLDRESNDKRKNCSPDVNPARQKKRFLGCNNAEHDEFIEQIIDDKTPKHMTNPDSECTFRGKKKASILETKDLRQEGSVSVSDSILSNKVQQSQTLRYAPKTGKYFEIAPNYESTDKTYPRISSTTSLNCIPKTRLTSNSINNWVSQCDNQIESSECRPFISNEKNESISENNDCSVRSVIDLTKNENEASFGHHSTVRYQGRSKKRKLPPFSHSLGTEKVIIIDDDPSEIQNELNLETSKPVASKVVSSTIISNEKIIDLTSCSGKDLSQHPENGVLTKQHSCKGLHLTTNSMGKVVDLTEGDEIESSAVISEKMKLFSDNKDILPLIDEVSSTRKTVLTKSVGIQNCKEVYENHNKSLIVNQELAVMCNTAPALGFIRVVRYLNGELMLNESFTARAYKHFDDLKALNTYLNQRFEKMLGVKDLGPLEWILATAGVVKLKKVPPINPKVWFHPNDYILTKKGCGNTLTVLPSNVSKIKSSPGKTLPSSSSYKQIASPHAVIRKIVADQNQGCQTQAIKSRSTTNLPVGIGNKPITARFVPVSSNNKQIQQLNNISFQNGQIYSTDVIADTKVIDLTKAMPSGPLDFKRNALPKNDSCGHQWTDTLIGSQSKDITKRSAVLLEKQPNHSSYTKNTTLPQSSTPRLLNGSTQSSNLVPPHDVQNEIIKSLNHLVCHSSSSQNCEVAIGNRANQLPAISSQNDVLCNPQSSALLNKYQNNGEANQMSSNTTQRSMDGVSCSPEFEEVALKNNEQTKAQPNLGSEIYLKTLNKHGDQSVIPLSIKFSGQYINKNSSCYFDKSSISQTQNVLANTESKDGMQKIDLTQMRTCQSVASQLNCRTSQTNKVQQHKVTPTSTPSTSPTAQSPRMELTKSCSYNNSRIAKLNFPLNGSKFQPIMEHPREDLVTNASGTVNTAEPVAFVSNRECQTSTKPKTHNNLLRNSTKKSSISQPMIVLVTNQSGEKTWKTILRQPSTSQTPLLVNNEGQSILANHSTSSTIKMPPSIVNSVAQFHDNQIIQPNFQISQPERMSTNNTECVTFNNHTTNHKVAFLSMSPMTTTVRSKPLVSSNNQSSTNGRLTVQQLPRARQSPNQSKQNTERSEYTDAMVYFLSKRENVKGIPFQKLLNVSKVNSKSVDTCKVTVATPSTSNNIFPPKINKPVKSTQKQSLPMKLNTTLNKDKPPLRLHWTTLNVRKPSLP